ncbi:MAG: tRNA pseudouridine(55) synthase TruB [Christensenellaceae bacterium]|jgi:tRNA pseudouridine55 synthase|nr:tRNA pseudouridine(55) synthase TruB [Christensenellaceae bacterium]
MLDGFLNLLKPPGMSSFDAIRFLKKLLPKAHKIGHMGTLDPLAAGVLPIGLGAATRLFDYVSDKEKHYIAEIRFGAETSTQDAAGFVTKTAPPPETDAVLALLPRFVGEIEQVPGAYSAIHVGGRRSYELARAGEAAPLPPRRVQIHAIEPLGSLSPHSLTLSIRCGRGTYVRSLAEDLGRAAGSRAYLAMLLRAESGPFTLEEAQSPAELLAAAESGNWPLLPMDFPLSALPGVVLPETLLKKVQNGAAIPNEGGVPEGSACRVYVGPRFAGIARASESFLRFQAMLLRQ